MQEAVAVAADPSQGLYLTLDLAAGWRLLAMWLAGCPSMVDCVL